MLMSYLLFQALGLIPAALTLVAASALAVLGTRQFV
jgi:hypothetical protein